MIPIAKKLNFNVYCSYTISEYFKYTRYYQYFKKKYKYSYNT